MTKPLVATCRVTRKAGCAARRAGPRVVDPPGYHRGPQAGGAMRIQPKLAVIAGTLALGALSAVGLGATGVASGHPTQSTTDPTGSGHPTQAKAYGRFCQSESKQHVAGMPGTPFSKCVTDMAKLANGSSTNPAKACQN